MSAHFDPVKSFSYIKGMAMGLHWNNTIRALNFARTAHDGQFRKGGEPYFSHPLTVACHAIALGLHDDHIIAACLLHDVIEDCNVSINDLPVDDETRHAVKLLTKSHMIPVTQKDAYTEAYYKAISEDRIASLIKILDRCNNVSTMAGVFTPEKIVEYIDETNHHTLPLIRTTKDQWPEHSEPLFVLKYHIMAITDGLTAAMVACDTSTGKREQKEDDDNG